MALTDEVYVIEKSGYAARYSGAGKVISQSLQAGAQIKKGQVIDLKLNSRS